MGEAPDLLNELRRDDVGTRGCGVGRHGLPCLHRLHPSDGVLLQLRE